MGWKKVANRVSSSNKSGERERRMNADSAAKAVGKGNALLAIGAGALLGGTVDLVVACVHEGWDIPLYVAAGLLGRQAIHGGAGTYILGVVLHFVIAFSAATIYYFAATRRLFFLKEHPLVCGLFYGMAIELVMRLIVLPISGLHAMGPYERQDIIRGLIVHMTLIGLPIGLSVWRFAK
jgi:hypothetical protein